MGQAGDKLARLLDTFVELSIPHIEVMRPSDIAMALQTVEANDAVSGVCQGFISSEIRGEAMLLFNDASFADLAKLMKYEGKLDKQAQRELLMDATNVLFGACLSGIAEQIDISFSYGPPTVIDHYDDLKSMLAPAAAKWDQSLVTEISYTLESYSVNCDLLIVFTESSIDLLTKKLDYLVA